MFSRLYVIMSRIFATRGCCNFLRDIVCLRTCFSLLRSCVLCAFLSCATTTPPLFFGGLIFPLGESDTDEKTEGQRNIIEMRPVFLRFDATRTCQFSRSSDCFHTFYNSILYTFFCTVRQIFFEYLCHILKLLKMTER